MCVMIISVFASIILVFPIFITNVQAECAWILWEKLEGFSAEKGLMEGVWEAQRALKTREACQGLLAHYIEIKTKSDLHPSIKRDVVVGDATGLIITRGTDKDGNSWSFEWDYRCFPDTLNPRATKH